MASGPFMARFGGECAECGDAFEQGDEIRYNDDDEIIGEGCCGAPYAEAWAMGGTWE